MTDCGCEKAKAELEEYLRHELERDEARDIREHMDGCVDCSTELHVNVVMTETIQRACKETAPDELRSLVLSKLRDLQSH